MKAWRLRTAASSTRAADLPGALKGEGIRIVEVPADRAAGTALRGRLAFAAATAVTALL